MKDHIYYVYMLASHRNGTLYVGVTNDVMRRTYQHKNELIEGFTKKYGIHMMRSRGRSSLKNGIVRGR
jgi:putative endonuclease